MKYGIGVGMLYSGGANIDSFGFFFLNIQIFGVLGSLLMYYSGF